MQSIFNNFAATAIEYDLNFKFVKIEGAIKKIIGYTEKQLLSNKTSWEDILHPDDREQLLAEFKALLSDDPSYFGSREYRVITKNSEIKWINEQIRFITDKKGKTTSIQGILFDNTQSIQTQVDLKEKKQSIIESLGLNSVASDDSKEFIQKQILGRKIAEAELLKKNEFLEKVIDSFTYPFYVIDTDTYNITLSNKKAKELYGTKSSTCYELSHKRKEPCGDSCVCPLQIVKSRKKPCFTEHVHYDKKGATKYFAVHGFPMFNDQNEVVQIIEYSIDITDQKLAEKALAESEEKYRLLFDNERDAVLLIDVKTQKILDANKMAQEIYQYSLDEFLQLKAQDISAEPEKTSSIIQNSDVDETINVTSRLHRKKDGTVFPLEASATTFKYKGKKTFCAIIRDITERKKREEHQARLEKRLHTSQKMNAIGTLAGGIAHDFNNILFAQIGYLEMALAKIPKEHECHDFLEESLSASLRASDLVTQILNFSRSDHVAAEPMSIAPILKETVKMMDKSIPPNIKIKSNIDVSCSNVIGNPVQLQQLILNLSANAEEAMKRDGGELYFELKEINLSEEKAKYLGFEKAGSYVSMIISDTGKGMTPEVKERIFEPYFTTKPYWEGSGMGLAVAHGIVTNNMQGAIFVESDKGKGAKFTMIFPALTESTENKRERTDQKKKLLKNQITVMLIDDDPLSVSMAQTILENLGYHVIVMTDAKEAIDIYNEEPEFIDFIIAGEFKTKKGAKKLFQQIDRRRTETQLILMTDEKTSFTENDLQKFGVSRCLAKPVSKHKLSKTLQELVKEKTVYPFV